MPRLFGLTIAAMTASVAILSATSAARGQFVVSWDGTPLAENFTLPSEGTPPAFTFHDNAWLFAYRLYARNVGPTSGQGVNAMEISVDGLPTLWVTSVLGAPRIVNYDETTGLPLVPNRSRLTAENVNDGDPTFFSETARLANRSPSTSWGAAGTGALRTGVVNNFSVAATAEAPVADSSLNNGKGLLIAEFIGPADIFTYHVTIGGSQGSGFHYSGTAGVFDVPLHTLNFPQGNVVTIDIRNPAATFERELVASIQSGLPPQTPPPPPTLLPGAIDPRLTDNLSITGDFADGPLTITGSGFDASDLGRHTIPFTLNYDGLQTRGYLVVNVVPEPTLAAGLGLLVLASSRSRR